MTTALVTDSTAYLPPDLADGLDLRVVPLHVVVGGQEHREGVDIDAAEVADALRAFTPVSTSRPAPAAFLEAYEAAARAGADSVVSVHISAELSSTVGGARLAAEQATVPVRVVDSRALGMAMGYAVLAGARSAASGAGLDDVERVVRETCGGATVVFYVDTLEYLRRGGRIGRAGALLGSALSIKPILGLRDGHIVPVERVRTSSRAIARIEELTLQAARGGRRSGGRRGAPPGRRRAGRPAGRAARDRPVRRERARRRARRGRRGARRTRHARGGGRPAAGRLTPMGLVVLGLWGLAAALAAFLLGAVNPATLLARALGTDLRSAGSGNPGATNAGRVLGRKWGALVLVLDVVKAYLPTLLVLRTLGLVLALVVGLAVVLGHVFSPFLRGRGGKGVACAFGAILAVEPVVALAAVVVFGVALPFVRAVGGGVGRRDPAAPRRGSPRRRRGRAGRRSGGRGLARPAVGRRPVPAPPQRPPLVGPAAPLSGSGRSVHRGGPGAASSTDHCSGHPWPTGRS